MGAWHTLVYRHFGLMASSLLGCSLSRASIHVGHMECICANGDAMMHISLAQEAPEDPYTVSQIAGWVAEKGMVKRTICYRVRPDCLLDADPIALENRWIQMNIYYTMVFHNKLTLICIVFGVNRPRFARPLAPIPGRRGGGQSGAISLKAPLAPAPDFHTQTLFQKLASSCKFNVQLVVNMQPSTTSCINACPFGISS